MRLLVTPPWPGALNMALDEVLLAALGPPVVRVYEWSPPTLSLGYGQRSADVDFAACERCGVAVTRRLTGGRAVLHHDELTYSVLLPADLLAVGRNVTRAYQLLCTGLLAALAQLGVTAALTARHGSGGGHDPACFATALGGDLAVDGRKLVGSAQCHKLGGVLQHGSLPRTVDPALLAACLHRPDNARSDWTCLAALGVAITPTDWLAALGEGYAPLLGAPSAMAAPTPAELAAAQALAASKYATAEWTQRL